MTSLIVILIGTVLVNTILLMHDDEALGGDRASGSISNAIRIAAASFVTLTLATLLTLIVWQALPNTPTDVALFVYSLATVFVAITLRRLPEQRLPRLHRSLASAPILIVSNCLALGAVLLNPMNDVAPIVAIVYSFALGGSFAAMLITFVTLVSRITEREVPAAFRLAPITLVSAGLVALALMGFTGLVRI